MIALRIIRTSLLVGVLLAFFCTPAHAQKNKFRSTRISIDDNGKSKYHWQNGRHSLKIEFEGDIEWLEDDSGIKSMSRGSYLKIDEKNRSERHSLVVEARSSNDLEYNYRRDGKKQAFDAEAEAWLAEVVPMLIRESGVGAESRVKRILDSDGVDGVLKEVDLIGSPGVKSLYLLHLIQLGNLTGEEAARTAHVATGISSPGEKRRFLTAAAKSFLIHDEAVIPFFDAVESISSPGDKTRTLIHLVESELLEDEDIYVLAMETAVTISSPGDKARFLQAAGSSYSTEAAVAYIKTANTISSPGDHARVLISLLDSRLESGALEQLLLSAKNISSPGDKARVLIKAAGQIEGGERVIETYLKVAESISSPGDRSRVLMEVIDEVDMSEASMLAWIETASTIGSPGDKARVLLRATDKVADNDELVEAYIEAAETISSPGDRRRVLEALLD